MAEKISAGIAFLLDENGFVVKLLHDTMSGPPASEKAGRKHIVSFFIPEAEQNVLTFLYDIKKYSAVFSRELEPIDVENQRNIYFSGVMLEKGIVIIGGVHPIDFQRFMAEMMALNNEQANLLRTVLHERGINKTAPSRISDRLYEELTRLNNELVTLQRESVKQNARLTELSAEKSKFVGMAAHDIRGPIGLSLNYIELMMDEEDRLSADQKHFMDNIQKLNNFVLSLVNNLLDVASIESGDFKLELSEVNYESFVKRNIEFNALLAGKKQIKIEYKPCREEVMVKVDKPRIDQVLNNLISNAVKFSFPGSTVTVSFVISGNRVITCIKDRGQGIPQEYLETIFKAFQRSTTKATGGERSTGLGLAIVKKIIEEHGGDIRVESVENAGSSFYFSLPMN